MASSYDLPLTCYDPGAFLRTGLDFIELASRPEVGEQWDAPSVVERMTVGGVAAHGLTALDDMLDHCERPEPATARFIGIVEYYRAARLDKRADLELPGHSFIVEDADRKAAEGQSAVIDRARAALDQLRWVLPSMSPDKRVYLPRQPPMAGSLAMMVSNRTVELAAHMDDVAVSVGVPTPEISPNAGAMIFIVLVSVARKMNGDLELMRAMARAERARPESVRAL
jgi:hypothetical protein